LKFLAAKGMPLLNFPILKFNKKLELSDFSPRGKGRIPLFSQALRIAEKQLMKAIDHGSK